MVNTTALADQAARHTLTSGMLRVSQRLHVTPDRLLAQLEQVAESLPAGADVPASSLSVWEENVLREAGSLGHDLPPLAGRASTLTAVRTAQLMTDALSAAEAATQMHVTPGRVRQRITAGTLFAVQTPAGWRLPRFQFTDTGVLAGLDRVLAVLPADVQPLVVARFFTAPSPDLLIDGEPTGVSQWLAAGGDIGSVLALAADLHRLQ